MGIRAEGAEMASAGPGPDSGQEAAASRGLGARYDGFISYSHAADDAVAPRLQAGLQRFAKPWWQTRAMRVFRDESNLGANPHLWSSITEAMDGSEWMVLLLSPDAAESEWVDKEVTYWLEHRPANRILPVVTEGEFEWRDGRLVSDATPPALRDAFEEEPRWVDLRFAHSDEQLDLKNPRFASAVADLAATIRGVPRDELESEEIRQHRRTVRTAWTAAVVLVLLAVFAGVTAWVAVDRGREAAHRETIARANEIALQSLLELESNPERSVLLALAAVDVANEADPPPLDKPIRALRQALSTSRVVARSGGSEHVAYSPDGSVFVTGLWTDADSDGPAKVDTAVYDAESGEQLMLLPSSSNRWSWRSSFSADGSLVAVGYERPGGQQQTGTADIAVIWDLATGERVRAFSGDASSQAGLISLSPDGSLLAVGRNQPDGVLAFDVETGGEAFDVDFGEGRAVLGPAFSPDGSVLAVVDSPATDEPGEVGTRVVLLDAESGAELAAFDASELDPHALVYSPDGRRLAALSQFPTAMLVIDLEGGGRRVIELIGAQVGIDWSPDGRWIAVAGNEGIVRVIDVETGEEVHALAGHGSGIWSVAFDPTRPRVTGAGLEGTESLTWDITSGGLSEVAAYDTPYPTFRLEGVRYDATGDAVLLSSDDFVTSQLALFDLAEEHVAAEVSEQFSLFPRHPLLAPDAGAVATLTDGGGSTLLDERSLEPSTGWATDGLVLATSNDRGLAITAPWNLESAAVVDTGSNTAIMELPGPAYRAHFHPDGDLVSSWEGIEARAALVNVADSAVLWWGLWPGDELWFPGAFSPDGRLLSAGGWEGGVSLYDVDALRAGAHPVDALVYERTAHDGAAAGLVFSDDSSLLATFGQNDRRLRVWSTEGLELVADLGEIEEAAGWPGFDFHPNGKHLIVSGPNGSLRVHTLDVEELVDIARSRLTRGFTDDECEIYELDPCPGFP